MRHSQRRSARTQNEVPWPSEPGRRTTASGVCQDADADANAERDAAGKQNLRIQTRPNSKSSQCRSFAQTLTSSQTGLPVVEFIHCLHCCIAE